MKRLTYSIYSLEVTIMGKSLNVPDKGDYLVFVNEYVFITQDVGAAEIPKGTLAKVIERFWDDVGGDELECKLLISLDFTGEVKVFKFNYSIHQDLVDTVPANKVTKLLYEAD